MKIDINKAKQLREEGCTYKEIAQTLGCSEIWCKTNLKTVKKHKTDDEILAQTMDKARSKEGITNIEIRHIIRTLHTNTFTKEDKIKEDKIFNRIKLRLREHKDCLVRPYWLQPHKAQQSFIELMQSTKLISDRIEEEVSNYIDLFNLDSSYANSVRWAIVSLTYAGSKLGNGTDAQSTINMVENLVNEFENRNAIISHIYTCVEKYSDEKVDIYTNSAIEEKVYVVEPDILAWASNTVDKEVDEDLFNYFDEASFYIDCERDNKWDGDEGI